MAHIAGVFPVVSTPFAADGGLLLDDLDRLTRYRGGRGAWGRLSGDCERVRDAYCGRAPIGHGTCFGGK